jgi:hypothetical protein
LLIPELYSPIFITEPTSTFVLPSLEPNLQYSPSQSANSKSAPVRLEELVEQRAAFASVCSLLHKGRPTSGQTRSSIGCSVYQHFGSVYSPSPVQTPVSLEITLSPLERNAPQRLEAKGRVARVTGTDQDSGFATTNRFELHEMALLSAGNRSG